MAHLGPGKVQTQLIDLNFWVHLGTVWRGDETGSLWSPGNPQNLTVNGLLLLCGFAGAHKASQINHKRRSLPPSLLSALNITIGNKHKKKIKGLKSVEVNNLNIFKDLG